MEIYLNKLQDELLAIYSSKSDCSESRDGFGFNDAFFRLETDLNSKGGIICLDWSNRSVVVDRYFSADWFHVYRFALHVM